MANWFTRYAGPGGGSGMGSWDRAIDDGYTPQQIAAAVDGSGLTVGWRLRDAADAVNAGVRAQQQAQRQVKDTESRLRGEYEGRIRDFENRLDEYKGRVNTLTDQYQGALRQSQEYQKSAADFEDKFNKRTTEFEAARQEADRYREEAVGQQLRAIRSGATTGGRQQTRSGIGDLTGGDARFQGSSDSAITKAAKAEGGLTDSVLNRKGPVVERLVTAQRRQAAPSGAPSAGLSRGRGASSYYASRFR